MLHGILYGVLLISFKTKDQKEKPLFFAKMSKTIDAREREGKDCDLV